MKTIAVTGGAGFIGSNLLHRLSKFDYKLLAIDDLTTGLASNLDGLDVDLREISIVDQGKLAVALSDADKVVHLAARGSVPRSVKDPVATHMVNTLGTLNILESCRVDNKHLIFSSSSSVYGANDSLPKTEKMWMLPLTPYAASKLSAEAFVCSYGSTYNLKISPFRFFNVFGPRQRPDHEYAAVIPKWIWKSIRNEPIELHGDGTQTRDFTYIETVCDILIAAIEREVITSEVVNLAYGNNISLNTVLGLLKTKSNNIVIHQEPSRLGDVKASQNDPNLLRSLYPEVSPIDFETAFEETYKWLFELSQKSSQ